MGKHRTTIRGKERISIRLSAADISGLQKIQASGDFEDMSATVRWCIHFTLTMMRMVPAALIDSFMGTDEPSHDIQELRSDDSLEKPAEEVSEQCNCENGTCK